MTLFDTSAIIDAVDPDSPWHLWAKGQIADAVATTGAAINAVVLSEACVGAEDPDALQGQLESWGLALLPLPVSASAPQPKHLPTIWPDEDPVARSGPKLLCPTSS